MTQSIIRIVFPRGGKVYEYSAEGSMNELMGATHAVVETRDGEELVKVVEIRPMPEKKYPYELKPVNELIYKWGKHVQKQS